MFANSERDYQKKKKGIQVAFRKIAHKHTQKFCFILEFERMLDD